MLMPLFGALIFACLYAIATLYYPGGTETDINSKGFDWEDNYWCNLLNQNALNGQYNSSRPIAMTGMFILCVTLAIFWYNFPRLVGFEKGGRLAIQISGVIAMVTGMFIFTNLHDTIINVASLCGLVSVIGTFAGLYKLKWTKLFCLGIFNIALIALNNILYYSKDLRSHLPVVQKITFICFLLWVCIISINLYRKGFRTTGFLVD